MTRITTATRRQPSPQPLQRLSGLDRRSCSWLDAVGPGYAVGPSSKVLRLAVSVANRSYCR